MPTRIEYKYLAKTSNPIIVEVINLKGEKVVTILKPWIVKRPDPICTKELLFCPGLDEEIDSTVNETSNTNSTEE